MPQKLGYLTVDHRASPGLTEEQARRIGYDPKFVAEGKFLEADTMTCAHCCTVVIKRPDRTRERHFCQRCGGAYICDTCAGVMQQPDYIHHSFKEIVDLAATGGAETLGSPQSLLRKG